MAATNITGQTDEIAKNGLQLVNFGGELEGDLGAIERTVKNVASQTFGDASPHLLDVYDQLHKELKKYVTVLQTLGANVQTSAKNMDILDSTAKNNLKFEK